MNLPLLHLPAQSIAEKKAELKLAGGEFDPETEHFLLELNRETHRLQTHIRQLYEQANHLYGLDAAPQAYRPLLAEIVVSRQTLLQLEERWRELVTQGETSERYGLWHAPDTTLEQLIIDYGSQDYVYLIPPEVGGIKLSINSNLPIPRAAWSEMLELILAQNGVGVRTLNPYLRQLYLVRENHAHLRLMTNKRDDLEVLSPETRVSFVLSPEPADVRRTMAFLERFFNPQTTTIQALGRDILLIGPVGDIQDLLRLYDFVSANRGDREYKLLPLSKLQADEMAHILGVIFDQTAGQSSPPPPITPRVEGKSPPMGRRASMAPSSDVNGLKIIVLNHLSQALFVVGTKEEVRKAEETVRQVESQMNGAREKTIFWYTVKHSDAEELADVLSRVYALMMSTGTGIEDEEAPPSPSLATIPPLDANNGAPLPPQKEPPLLLYQQEGFYQEGGYIVNPAPAQPRVFSEVRGGEERNNFIVDIKTGAIVMVVEADVLPKIRDLLRRLDVPKRMVHIETLLFEKVLNRENNMGLNLLKIGGEASDRNRTGVSFNNLFPKHAKHLVAANAGIFEFFLSRKESNSGIPAFDIVYRFLLNQEDVQINSNPSLMTINQTPATIAINEDISINTGIFEVETAKGTTLKDAFTRAQYGITISIKPTIHLASCEDYDQEFDYVTLETDITFDTIHPGGHSDRPDVTRRHITNQVQVPDGETVILGGLRRKVSHDSREAIPFLGELPGLGKLFSINRTRDNTTEMFIFITPHIVKDPKEQLNDLRQQLLCLRPGDVPYFLACVEEAHRYEKTRLMEGSMTLLFGRPRERYYTFDSPSSCDDVMCGEYDGR